jgi:uncharacterized protein
MNRLIGLILSVLLLFAAGFAYAVKVDSLYKAEVPVTSQSKEEQSRAIQVALLQVLTKVSGNNPILKNPDIKSRLGDPQKLVQQIGYTTPSLLNIDFDSAGVNDLLRGLNIPIWSQNRPLIIIWIDRETLGHPTEVINSDPSNEVVALLKQNADQRGLPIIFPLMDIADLNQVSPSDVSAMNIPKLTTASKRYAGEGILIGRIIQGANGLVTEWKLVLGNNQWNWNLSAKTLNDIVPTLVENITNTLAARFAVTTTNAVQAELTLKVSGVTQEGDLAQLVKYLEHLAPVASVTVAQISGGNVVLTISLRGTQDAFTQSLSLGNKLTTVNAAEWTYQWNH